MVSDKQYIAHTREDGRNQEIKDHAKGVAELAAEFASAFGAGDIAYQTGLVHDIGKYSDKFQKRIMGGSERVDHSTAGAKEMYSLGCLPGAYCVAGHHSGLMNGGGKFDNPGTVATLYARLNKIVEDYSAYKHDIMLSKPVMPEIKLSNRPGFTFSFFIRMLYSSLVDADYLDTERFIRPETDRDGGADTIEQLNRRCEEYIEQRGWLNGKGKINKKRSEILSRCIEIGKEGDGGLYTLTVPTGGGKTVSSLAFALELAEKKKLNRVIFVVPYCSIIDQTVAQYREILGSKNVLAHYSEAEYQHDEDNGNMENNSMYLAAENWDKPVIVTTAVQFFESLFSNRCSRCRKLHNVAKSVVIFDEAQLIPMDYLRPCVSAIAELTINYNTSCVLCTATQPSLDCFFQEYSPKIMCKEIMKNPEGLQKIFQRASYQDIGVIDIDSLSKRLLGHDQVLCIVSTRREAKELFSALYGENIYHLSTLMIPSDRKKTIAEIRKKLASGENCKVISTSLIEAGVDLDFPIVYRARTGLDSIVQAGGRCNREGKHRPEDSMVYVFDLKSARRKSSGISRMQWAMKKSVEQTDDYSSLPAIHRYFSLLYKIDNSEGVDYRQDVFDKKMVLKSLEKGISSGNGSFPFADIAKCFRLIDDQNTKTILIPKTEIQDYVELLLNSKENVDRSVYRKIGPYCISIYSGHYQKIQSSLIELNEGMAVLSDMSLYCDETGLELSLEDGDGYYLC